MNGMEGQNFLLTQIQILQAHIDSLITNNTTRINAFLLVCMIAATLSTFFFKENNFTPFIPLVAFALLGIGLYYLRLAMWCNIEVVRYFRIINRIRNYFDTANSNLKIKDLCFPLPLTDKEPKRFTQVFDPGLFLLMGLNSILFALGLLTLLRLQTSCFMSVLLLLSSLVFCIQLLYIKKVEQKNIE